MQNHTLSLLLVLTGGLLLTSCSENTAGDENDRSMLPSPAEPQPDNHEADQPAAQSIPVAYFDAITALRKETAEANKVLIIDCWATWCGSCVAMFPHLHKAMKERGDGVLLVSLSFDEGENSILEAGEFLTKHNAWDNALRAASGFDAKDAIGKALSDNWDGGVLPAVFVYKPDGTTAYELLETRGEVADWVEGITKAVDAVLPNEDESTR